MLSLKRCHAIRFQPFVHARVVANLGVSAIMFTMVLAAMSHASNLAPLLFYGLEISATSTRLGAEVGNHIGSVDMESHHTFLLYITTGSMVLMSVVHFPTMVAL